METQTEVLELNARLWHVLRESPPPKFDYAPGLSKLVRMIKAAVVKYCTGIAWDAYAQQQYSSPSSKVSIPLPAPFRYTT